jgi:hypothetical protein
MAVQPAIAPELRILYNLERWYRVPRPSRFLRIREHQRQARPPVEGERRNHLRPSPAPAPTPAEHGADDDAPDGQRLEISIGLEPEFLTPVPPPAPLPSPPERPVTAPAAAPAPPAARAVTAPPAAGTTTNPPRPLPKPHGYGELGATTLTAPAPRLDAAATMALLATAKTRDDIGDLITAYLRGAFICGLVLICKDEMALGWKGCSIGVEQNVIGSIAVPLGSVSMLSAAHDRKTVSRGAPPAEGAPLQNRLWKLLRTPPPKEVIVVPIVLRDRVVNLVYAHCKGGVAITTEQAAGLVSVCQAAQTAFLQLIQAKKTTAK